MTNKLSFFTLVLGFSLASDALAQEQNSSISQTTEYGVKILTDYMYTNFDQGNKLDEKFINHIIAVYNIDINAPIFPTNISDPYNPETPNTFSLLAAFIDRNGLGRVHNLRVLTFDYIQDIVKAGAQVPTDCIDTFLIDKNDAHWNVKESLYTNETLLIKFKQTMEFLIEQGADCTSYDIFMEKFEKYKNDQMIKRIQELSTLSIVNKNLKKAANVGGYTFVGALIGIAAAGAATAFLTTEFKISSFIGLCDKEDELEKIFTSHEGIGSFLITAATMYGILGSLAGFAVGVNDNFIK